VLARLVPAALAAAFLLSTTAGPAAATKVIRTGPGGTTTTKSAAGSGPNWRSWDEGLRESASSRRPVVVDVYTDWCGWCKRMDRDVYARADVRDYLDKRFVSIKLNAESRANGTYEGKTQTSRALAQRFGVNGYPTTVFLKQGGDHLVNVSGYIPAERFLKILRFIGDGHMDRGTSWEDYEKQGAAGGTP
jgi:thioredoxin-related protein